MGDQTVAQWPWPKPATPKPDLLIKDVNPERLLKRIFITPLDYYLLQESSVPLHLLPCI
jgi:universal stress protein E